MRITSALFLLLLLGCRSETAWRSLEVSTNVEIKLPANALYGNISSFEGFNTTAPEVFVEEHLRTINGSVIRDLVISDNNKFVEELMEKDDSSMSIKYRCIQSTLPVENLEHQIQIIDRKEGRSVVIWESNLIVQNQYRDQIKEKLKGIQEAYLFSLELLGEELDILLNDPEF